MKVKNGKEVLDFEGIFIELDEKSKVGIFLSDDSECDFDEYECVGDKGEIEVNGKIIKWGVLFS
jgi:hypothetical protein